MDSTFTLFSLAAGLLLSIACAALLEELIFGGIFRLFFAPRAVEPRNQYPHSTEVDALQGELNARH